MSSDDKVNEILSALMDGELSREDTLIFLTLLKRNPSLQKIWENYSYIQFFLREQAPLPRPADLAARVKAQIANEPTKVGMHALLSEQMSEKSHTFVVSHALRKSAGNESS